MARFRAALASTPDYPDALNNLGYALLLTGRDDEARALYEKALALQPDFPEALNNLGLLVRPRRRPGSGGTLFPGCARGGARTTARRPTTWRWCSSRSSRRRRPSRLLEDALKRTPGYETGYVTLAKIYASAGRKTEAIAVLDRLLQRDPSHAGALELRRLLKGL